jgi:7-alpha-hydroxysteroid dehydrogenase
MNTLSSMFRLDGQVAVVTGASKGIGRAISLVFAEAGAKVVLAARTLADLEVVAEEIRARGGNAIAVACDVEQAADRERLVVTTVAAYGTIHLLVNNAGGSGPNDALTTSADEFNAVLARNVTQPFVLAGLVVPHMRTAGGGAIINITSAAARLSQPYFSAYGAAKAALTQLTRNHAQDFAPLVRVNAIAPGPVLTAALAPYLTDEVRASMTRKTPLQRLGEPEDIAAAALYLAAPASRWMTGKVLELDGGAEWTVWG